MGKGMLDGSKRHMCQLHNIFLFPFRKKEIESQVR